MYDFETLLPRNDMGSVKWDQLSKYDLDFNKDIFPLSIADMEIRTAPEIVDGLKEFLDKAILGYTIPYPDYLESVKNWMKRRHDFIIEEDWIVCTQGVIAAISASIRGLSEENEGVIIMPPVYYPFSNIVKKNKRKLINCPLIEINGHYYIDFDLFEIIAKDPNNKLLLFSSPHNPIGRVWSKDELERLSKICVDNNLIVISDEVHNDIIMPGYTHNVLSTISDDIADRAIICTSPSKSFNIAGLGIANVIISNSEIKNKFVEQIEAVTGNMFGIIGYKACEIAYKEAEKWLDELIMLIYRNNKIVNEFFKDNFPTILAPMIEGTYLQWIDFRTLNLSNYELEEFLHDRAGLILDEGYMFGVEGNGYERLNLAAPTWVIERALDKIKISLEDYL